MVTDYLTQADLQSSIRDERLSHILDNDDVSPEDLFGDAVFHTTSIVGDHLERFEIAAEFEKSGTDRNGSVMYYCKHICLYIIYERIDDDEVPERIVKNYDDTIETLRQIAKGKMSISIPLKLEDTDGDGEGDKKRTKFRWGGDAPRKY